MTLNELMNSYTSVIKLKRGGQKTVYKVQLPDGRYAALKIILNVNDARVLQEIEIVKDIHIDNVPVIYDNGTVYDESFGESILYIVEEFIDGESLRDYLNKGQIMNLQEAAILLKTLLEIEVQLEQKKILHRDINPNNILLGLDGQIYLIDFGLAKNLLGTSLTNTGALNGPFTPGYAPFEQFANIKSDQNVWTDLFQIGVTIYECCKGSNPFITPTDNTYQIMSRTMTVIPETLVLPGDNKGFFAALVNMLIAKNPSQRPDSAEKALNYLLAIEPTLLLTGR